MQAAVRWRGGELVNTSRCSISERIKENTVENVFVKEKKEAKLVSYYFAHFHWISWFIVNIVSCVCMILFVIACQGSLCLNASSGPFQYVNIHNDKQVIRNPVL